jgi:hypothetical protein
MASPCPEQRPVARDLPGKPAGEAGAMGDTHDPCEIAAVRARAQLSVRSAPSEVGGFDPRSADW